jgi:adenylylsulfate kinase
MPLNRTESPFDGFDGFDPVRQAQGRRHTAGHAQGGCEGATFRLRNNHARARAKPRFGLAPTLADSESVKPCPIKPPVPPTDLHPIFDRVLDRAAKESRLRQRARAIWLYGLSGSGKSTLAVALEGRLFAAGYTTHLLDGDNVRTGLNKDLGFSEADRAENIRRVAETAKLFVQAGVIAVCAFITPLRAHRRLARDIVGPADFIETHVAASFAACAKRDPKGLYAKAGAGGVAQFTGRDSAFEPPEPEDEALIIDTETLSPEAALARLYAAVEPKLRFLP